MNTIFQEIEKIGAKLFLLDGALKLSALPGTITPVMLEEIKKHKAEIMTFITQHRDVTSVAQETAPIKPYRKTKIKPSQVALTWLLEHRQALDDAGWTRAELYRRNKSKQGIAWLKLWEEAFSRAYLNENGTIEFECSIHGRDYFQTARPAAMAPTKDPIEVKS